MKRTLDTNAYVAMRRGEPSAIDLVRDADSLTFSLAVVGELL
jgi:predicted nucleic acid-binding protein